jgi:hypothetical protein
VVINPAVLAQQVAEMRLALATERVLRAEVGAAAAWLHGQKLAEIDTEWPEVPAFIAEHVSEVCS